MKNQFFSNALFLIFLLVVTHWLTIEAKTCNPSGKIKGKKPPPGPCNTENDSDCCKQGKFYTTYECSPRVSGKTKAVLTINSFEKGGDGGGPSKCDGQYHSNNFLLVALSSQWYNHGQRCLKYINIYYKDTSVRATVCWFNR